MATVTVPVAIGIVTAFWLCQYILTVWPCWRRSHPVIPISAALPNLRIDFEEGLHIDCMGFLVTDAAIAAAFSISRPESPDDRTGYKC